MGTTDLGRNPSLGAMEKQAHERSPHGAGHQAIHCQLPGVLLLARAGVDVHHEPDNVDAAGNVEDLEHRVPPAPPRRHPEEIEVARAEDQHVEQLREERDAFGRLVGDDGADEDAFRGRMAHVPQDAEDVHRRHCAQFLLRGRICGVHMKD